MGTPEHAGRVRGVGGLVTPSVYFHKPHPSSNTKNVAEDEQRWRKEKTQILTEYSQMAKLVQERKSQKRSDKQTSPISEENIDKVTYFY